MNVKKKGSHLHAVFQRPPWVLQLTETCSLPVFFFFCERILHSNWFVFARVHISGSSSKQNAKETNVLPERRIQRN